MPKNFLGTPNGSSILHCTKTITINNFSVIKSQIMELNEPNCPKMTILKDFLCHLGSCLRPLWAILSMPNNFFGTHNGLDILHCTKIIILTNYSIIKSQTIVLKWAKLYKNDYFKGIFIQFGGCFRPLWLILSMPNNFLDTLNGSGILHCYIFVQKSERIGVK